MSNQKVVLVCGASGGLGPVVAETMVREGMRVFGTMRDPSMAPSDLPFEMVALDVTDEASVAACIETVVERAGRIDVVINCFNNMILGTVEETSPDEMKHLYDVNLFGVMRVARAVVPQMRTQGGGTIVNMSSLGGLLAVPFLSAYTSCKFAIEAFSEALRHEVKKDGIEVVIMQPVAMRMDRPETGAHLGAASGVGPDSLTHRMIARMAKDTAESKLTPQMVADEILRVLKSDKKKLRYPMDRAKPLTFIKRFAPQSFIDRMIGGLMSS